MVLWFQRDEPISTGRKVEAGSAKLITVSLQAGVRE